MTEGARSRRNDKPSINYKYNPHRGAIFDTVDVNTEDLASSSRDGRQNSAKQAETSSSHVLSTAELISGVSQLWNFASSSLPVLRHKTTSTLNTESLHKENRFYYPAEEGNIVASISSEGQNVSVNLKADSDVSPTANVQMNLDFLHVAKKMCSSDYHSENHIYSHLLRCLDTASSKTILSCNEKKVSSATISYGLQNIYGWMSSSEHDKGRSYFCCNTGETANVERSNSDNTSSLDDGTTTETDVCYIGIAETLEAPSTENAKKLLRTSTGCLLSADNLLNPIQDVEADNICSIVSTSNLEQDSRDEIDDDLHEIKEDQESKCVIQDNSDVQIISSLSAKPQNALAKQEHAFAGAFAGVFVSLCLHPMDTVKTVIQSCPTDQRSIQYIGKSIISERGLSGLYRGISSNIASSAPISAIYTFSYESVKGALLPLFAKEYHSLVHCVAGGCASIATSFVFTPSERIKQQMQVGSHYHNCWNALLGIVGKGGFISLYNGWGAVLCRNVPHSIIKFYTYESLKNVMLSSQQAQAQPTTTSTLLCGGLAGSTAALFTTPFDVVKTRLQTQIPGSINRYHGVFNTLKDIALHEGLKGLYRGLTPRLAMYMTQGALFFASYESFKSLFSLDATQLESSSLSS